MNSAMEKIFNFIDQHATEMQKEQDLPYLESLLETTETWLDGHIQPSEQAGKEDVRKAIQLAVLKGMKEHVQPHHQMTPDALGLLVGYLVELFVKEKEFTLLDPALGTGNLLLTVMNYLDGRITGAGVEIDDMLIRLAASTADLVEQPVTFYRQDALQPLLIDPVDAVVADLPVGYYPDEEIAATYELKAEEGLSYAHHLFIEQALKHTVDGGYLFLVIPKALFESPQAGQLHTFLKKTAYIQSVMELPDSLFKNSAFAKGILILQKKKEGIKAPKEVLLARVPSMSNANSMAKFFSQVSQWFKENKQ
ncbi:class I SAM-dependent methyltransferase [Planococcus shenhongbingii]|uniref:Class I SAM-dependent methyltransferase n=1 Tax=Planococcus shenhongbingii TaxID=3058398 RepID=A0ABT8NDN5_9BACL|nr:MULTISPECIES: class I SAM-dependent methyltransferase [unclassified Planococcus (in: firmicutes)]MDN7246009.1 class I SAM-dependent methyltransferase [Planococcus sp. N017]WKA59861.1 class I SAM-dependent methyltransferase [Planococcus sp. N016]